MLKQFAQSIANLTVMLMRCDLQAQVADGLGTAFFCHPAGYLLTCAHTFKLADKLGIYAPMASHNAFVPLSNKGMHVLYADVRQYDAIHDIALLKLAGPLIVTVPGDLFLGEDKVQVGSSVAYAGFPFSGDLLHARHLGTSVVSAKVRAENGTKQFQLDATIHNGTSGGPLVEVAENKIIGVVSGRFSPTIANRVRIAGLTPGGDTAIGYATSISYGIELMRAEGLDV